MALRFMDGFDWTQNGSYLQQKWDATLGSNWSTHTGRFGGRAVSNQFDGANDRLHKTLDAQQTWIVGRAFVRKGTTTDGHVMILFDGATEQLTFYRDDDVIKVYRGTTAGTLLGTSTAVYDDVDVWKFLQIKVFIHNSTGTIDIQVIDGATTSSVLSLSGIDTQNTANSSADKIVIGGMGATNLAYTDDLYICDGTGTVNNDFLGDVRVETLLPNANGNSSQFTGSDGNSTDNYLLVDDPTVPDDDTTYVQSTTLNHIDLYGMSDLSSTPSSINGIATNVFARKTDVDTRAITEKARSGGANYSGSTLGLASTYRMLQHVRETDPNTAAAWTTSGVNAIEAGFEVTT